MIVYGGEQRLNGKIALIASSMTLCAPEKCFVEQFYFDGFFKTSIRGGVKKVVLLGGGGRWV